MLKMKNASTYKLENWKDPEILFDDVYQPFNLYRDMNEGLDLDFFYFDRDLISQTKNVNILSKFDEEKEDAKCNPLASTTQGIGNVDTVSELGEPYGVDTGDERFVIIPSFNEEGASIKVTKIRKERILKQREKRREFLKAFPEYALPFKMRSRETKYKMRSIMAKNRVRNNKGKFSKGDNTVETSEFNQDEVMQDNKTKRKRRT